MANGKVLEIAKNKDREQFFKFQDLVQIRYEMLRESITSGKSITEICTKYNYSRERFYHFKKRFEEEGILGLIDRRGGPKKPHKVNKEIEEIIIVKRKNKGKDEKSIYTIAQELKKEGIAEISAKTVERVLKKYNLTNNSNGVKRR